tara:strand:- start:151 stop:1446 length:1296 start_codon:yes stop_codon:yes gene_type:complete
MENENNILLKSEEFQEIIGQAPAKIIRWGISVFFAIVVLILIVCSFVPYPDSLNGEITLITENPPVEIVAKSATEISYLKVKNNQKVKRGEFLGMLKNSASLEDIKYLKNQIQTEYYTWSKSKCEELDFSSKNLKLGSVTDSYNNFIVAFSKYLDFNANNFEHKKIEIKKIEIQKSEKLVSQYKNQELLKLQEYNLNKKQFQRDSMIFLKNMMSQSEFEKKKSFLINTKQRFQDAKILLAKEELNVIILRESLLAEEFNLVEKKNNLKRKLEVTYDFLKEKIREWESAFILTAPVTGKVVFTKIWSENRFVNFGEKIMTIIPIKSGEIEGHIEMQQNNIGELKLGERVNVKLKHFPYMEHGLVYGEVSSISSTAEENLFIVKVSFPSMLKSSYNKTLKFSQGMTGSAEILTEEISLLFHFIKPIKSLFKNN